MTSDWKQVQRRNVRSWAQLMQRLDLPGGEVHTDFPINIPERFLEKMARGTWDDPILRQFVPSQQEEVQAEGFTLDPLQEGAVRRTGRLLQKYQGRVLLMPSKACAVHCRYCFRRHTDKAAQRGLALVEEEDSLEAALQQIASDATLREVILSGGDPLSMDNGPLEQLCARLDAIPHLKRLRFHTRFPIGIPERIDAGFLELLARRRLQVWFVVHCNHPRELDDDVIAALQRILRLGIPVLNHAVLLRGVNDQANTLQALCERLVDAGILPYYLNQLDRVIGSAHFEVPEEEGHELMGHLTRTLSGYAVPRYAKEVPGAPSKVVLHPLQRTQSQ